jgi:DNA methylase
VVTDPPYGIGFHNERWDGQDIRAAAARTTHARLNLSEAYQAWSYAWGQEVLRVLKPGGQLLAFGSPRTAHRLAAGLEDAGLQLHDTVMWLYGTGMPKSRRLPGGRGTTVKPAYGPILLARRPSEESIARTVERHGTGALNIDHCRIEGRYPANVLYSHSPGSAPNTARAAAPPHSSTPRRFMVHPHPRLGHPRRRAGSSTAPRSAGASVTPAASALGAAPSTSSPTPRTAAAHRPLATRIRRSSRWDLCAGSCGSRRRSTGSTGAAAALEGRRFLGIELDADYAVIARARIAHWAGHRARSGAT